jgi:hypothetical protein
MVIANGKVVMERGRVLGLDEEKILSQTEKIKKRFV